MSLNGEIARILGQHGGRLRHLEALERSAAGEGAPIGASYVTTEVEADLTNEQVLGTVVIMRGLAGARPAAAVAGRIYIETDGSFIVWRDNGAGWNEITRGEAGIRLAQLAERLHSSTTGRTANDHHPQAHTLASHSSEAHAELSPIGEPFSDHLNNPCARVYRSTLQSIPNLAWTPISFSHERFDTDNIWVIGSPTRLTCRTAGIYQLSGGVEWDDFGGGTRFLGILINGGNQIVAEGDLPGDYDDRMALSTLWALSVGHWAELVVLHNAGGNRNIKRTPDYSPEFGMTRVG